MTNCLHFMAATVLVAACVAGCKSPEAQLEGKWKFSDVKVPANMQAQASAAKQAYSSATAEFKADKSFTMAGPIAVEGTWALAGHAVSMTLTKVNGQDLTKLKKLAESMAKTNPQAAKQIEAVNKPINATLADDGRTLSIEASQGNQGELVLQKDTGS